MPAHLGIRHIYHQAWAAPAQPANAPAAAQRLAEERSRLEPALLEGGVSRWGWAQNSLVTVDPATHEFRFNHEHYLLKHVSHFVRPGAQVLPTLSFTGHENQLAFRNPDGEIVLVAHNDLGVEQTVAILIDGAAFEPTLAADSFNTFVIPPRRS